MATTLFSLIDGVMAGLPGLLRLLIWALIASGVSMGLYRLTSPQKALQRIRDRRAAVQQQLNAHEGSMGEAMPLLGTSLRLAFEQLFRVLWPTAVAALPVIALILWLDMTYGYRFPEPGVQVGVETTPLMPARLERPAAGSEAEPWTVSIEAPGSDIRVPLPLPVPVLHKEQWWNALLANPAGYLPPESPVEDATLSLPYREYLPWGPDWLRAWYAPFFVSLFAASLAIKIGFRII